MIDTRYKIPFPKIEPSERLKWLETSTRLRLLSNDLQNLEMFGGDAAREQELTNAIVALKTELIETCVHPEPYYTESKYVDGNGYISVVKSCDFCDATDKRTYPATKELIDLIFKLRQVIIKSGIELDDESKSILYDKNWKQFE